MIKKEIKNKVGIIYLDRPSKINAINAELIRDLKACLIDFENDNNIRAVILDSKCEKGFCAGGDLKEIYQSLKLETLAEKNEFFRKEFDLDKYVYSYSKPMLSHWFGVVMGGGVGLSINSDLVIVDESVNWAMPETRLGFVPDVGVGKKISDLPQSLGQYLGLSGASLGASDLIKYGLADIYINSKDYDELINKLITLSEDFEGVKLLAEFKKEAIKYINKTNTSKVEKNMENINKYFSKPSLIEIFQGLEEAKDDEFAKKTLAVLNEKSPSMLAIQFEKYFAGKLISQEETFDLDLRVINYGIENGAMEEGIRSFMIDKTKESSWPVKSIYDMDLGFVKELLDLTKDKFNN